MAHGSAEWSIIARLSCCGGGGQLAWKALLWRRLVDWDVCWTCLFVLKLSVWMELSTESTSLTILKFLTQEFRGSSHFCSVCACVVLCPNRDSGDLPWCPVVVVLTAAISSIFLQSMGTDDRSKREGWQTQKQRRWMAGQAWMEELLAEAVTIDGRREWYCSRRRMCGEGRMCQTNIPSVLQGKYRQAVSTKAGRSCSDSSSSGDCEDLVLAHNAHRAEETELPELRDKVKRLKKEGHRLCSSS